MTRRRAECSCGGLFAVCEGDPVRISVCHCLNCKRRTGSAFGVTAWYPADQVTISGPSKAYERVGDSGGRATFQFCPECGNTLCWAIDQMPGRTAIAVGAFADPGFPPPKVSVYETRRCAWLDLNAPGLERFD
jgi:hypothetical protein